jgi:hypothetical protein
LRGSDGFRRLALAALAWAAAGCSGRTVVAVDPYPCPDAGPYGCPPGLLDDLIGFWRLNDGAGSAGARDWSGWGNDGKLTGLDPATGWAAGGPEGTALSVQGKGYVNVVPSPSIDSITDQLTVVASIYLEGPIVEYATAISREIGSGLNQLYHLSVDGNERARLIIDAPDAHIELGGHTTVPHGTWLHLAGTWDGAEARLYFQGVEVNSGPLSSAPFRPETNPLVLAGNGNGADGVTELVPGQLADVMLYRRALSAAQIAQLASGALLPGTGRADAGGQ